MAERLKDSFGPEVAEWIGHRLEGASPGFDADPFVAECVDGLAELELMDRARRIADVMTRHLPLDPRESVPIVTACLGPVEAGLTAMAPMRYLPLTLFVGQVGLPAFEESMTAQYELTKRFTAEFSIRAFLVAEPHRTLARLREWAGDPDEHVRRLVSEGTRPRLPWAPRLPAFVADPGPVIELLEILRDDPSEYVRRSVANNLNDISKDHPEVVVALAERWWVDGGPQRRRLLRHALRTLVKRGDPTALAVLGHAPAEHVQVVGVTVQPAEVAIGDSVRITVELVDSRPRTPPEPAAGQVAGPAPGPAAGPAPEPAAGQVAVDLVVHFVRPSGRTSERVFKGGLRTLGPGETATVARSISLAQLSTRTHHPGWHRVQVQVNGRRVDGAGFDVVAPPG